MLTWHLVTISNKAQFYPSPSSPTSFLLQNAFTSRQTPDHNALFAKAALASTSETNSTLPPHLKIPPHPSPQPPSSPPSPYFPIPYLSSSPLPPSNFRLLAKPPSISQTNRQDRMRNTSSLPPQALWLRPRRHGIRPLPHPILAQGRRPHRSICPRFFH